MGYVDSIIPKPFSIRNHKTNITNTISVFVHNLHTTSLARWQVPLYIKDVEEMCKIILRLFCRASIR
jgi:hypothetical protein